MGVSVRQAEKIATVVKAANVKVESYWPTLFAKLLEKRSVEDLILSVGSGIPPTLPYYVYVCAHDGNCCSFTLISHVAYLIFVDTCCL